MIVNANAQNAAQHSKPGSESNPSALGTVDLSQAYARTSIAAAIKASINAYAVKEYDDGHRKHLGASLIGRECARELWYTFRWAKHKSFDGRMQRLFQRGHLEEWRFIEYLEGIGAVITAVDETQPVGADGEHPQIRISGCGGHFGGSLDGEVILPPEYGYSKPMICEFKTFATKPFSELTRDGVRVKKHEHFSQMSIYGLKRKRKYGLYMAVNKNDDDLHIEIVELDWELGQRLEAKAERIILSQTPPPKLSETITFQKCAYCDMKDVCHQAAAYEKNCRSCKFAQPIDNKGWHCQGYNATIPEDVIAKGCDNWSPAV